MKYDHSFFINDERLCGGNLCNRTATYFSSWFAFANSISWDQLHATVALTNNPNNPFQISVYRSESVWEFVHNVWMCCPDNHPTYRGAWRHRFQRPVSTDQTPDTRHWKVTWICWNSINLQVPIYFTSYIADDSDGHSNAVSKFVLILVLNLKRAGLSGDGHSGGKSKTNRFRRTRRKVSGHF